MCRMNTLCPLHTPTTAFIDTSMCRIIMLFAIAIFQSTLFTSIYVKYSYK